MPHRNALVHLETAVVESPIYLCLGEHALAPLGDVVVKPRGEEQARHDTFPEEIAGINQPVQRLRIAAEYLLLHVLLRAVAAYVVPLVG